MIYSSLRKSRYGIALGLALTVLLLPVAAWADSSIFIQAGYLRKDTNTALNPGALLLLVAAGSNNGTTFSNAPASGNYVGGSDIILNAFAFNTNGGTSGTGGKTKNSPTVDSTFYDNGLNAGNYVELVWYPTITYAQYMAGTTPAGGTVFGAYNPKLVNSTQSLAPDGGQNWTLPGDGSTVTLFFLTTDAGGTQPVSEGNANFAVVPEPSTTAMLGGGIIGLAALWSRKRSARLG